MSRRVRVVLLARHIVTILFFFLTNLYLQVSILVFALSDKGFFEIDNSSPIVLVAKILFACQGMIMPFTRLFEPVFYQILCKKIKAVKCSCCSKSELAKEMEEERAHDKTFLDQINKESSSLSVSLRSIDLTEEEEKEQDFDLISGQAKEEL